MKVLSIARQSSHWAVFIIAVQLAVVNMVELKDEIMTWIMNKIMLFSSSIIGGL
jgi:hypothetical protein